MGFAVVVATSDRSATLVDAKANGSRTARSGAPGEQDCTDCHTQNTGPGQIQITAPASYTAGQTVQIVVTQSTTDPTRRSWGFQLTALDMATNSKAGTLLATTTKTEVVNSATRQYMNQTGSGSFTGQANGATWTFNWTAPAASVGPVRFYVAGLQADNSGDEDGDQTYLTNVTSQPAGLTPTPTPVSPAPPPS